MGRKEVFYKIKTKPVEYLPNCQDLGKAINLINKSLKYNCYLDWTFFHFHDVYGKEYIVLKVMGKPKYVNRFVFKDMKTMHELNLNFRVIRFKIR